MSRDDGQGRRARARGAIGTTSTWSARRRPRRRSHTQADAALFHFTHDVLREDAALDNVLAHLKPGARVVATGLQWAPPWMWPTNGFVMAAALYSVTALESLARPWDKLERAACATCGSTPRCWAASTSCPVATHLMLLGLGSRFRQ